MTAPVRLQLSRQKGFNLQETSRRVNGLPAINVARPGMYGNYPAVRCHAATAESAVDAFRAWLDKEASAAWKGRVGIDLRGKNLACWCKPGSPCHADVLLELANR